MVSSLDKQLSHIHFNKMVAVIISTIFWNISKVLLFCSNGFKTIFLYFCLDSCFYLSLLIYTNLTILNIKNQRKNMSLTRKKVMLNDYLQLSLTQKLREHPSRNQFRRKCCQKQNDHCKEGRQCRSKQESKSMKKLMKKKYLEEEVEKLLQKRANESDHKINLLKEKKSNEIEGLRQDLKSMKDVIFKLSYDDGKEKRDGEEDQREEQFNAKCNDYEKRIDYLKKDLEKAYLKVRESQKKCGEQTTKVSNLKKEAKEYCKKIQSLQQAVQAKTKNQRYLQVQLLEAVQSEKNLKQNLQMLESEVFSLKQALVSRTSNLQAKQKQNSDFVAQIQGMMKSNQLAINTLKSQKQGQFLALKQQLHRAQQAFRSQSQVKIQLQNSLQKMKQQLKSTSIDLGNTKVKLTVLSSMQKKCQQLFDQIKSEKQKWSQYNLETTNERQNYEKRISTLEKLKLETEEQIALLYSRQGELLSQIKRLQSENKRLFQDKINLSKQIKALEQNLSEVAEERRNNNIKAELLKKQTSILEEALKQKQKQWRTVKLNQQKKIESLQNEKYQMQKEINKNISNTKNQISHLQSKTASLHNQIDKLTQQKEILNQNFKQLLEKVISNQNYTEKLEKQLKEKDSNIQIINQELKSLKICPIVYERKVEQIRSKAEQQSKLLKSKFQSQVKAKEEQAICLKKYNDLLKKNLEESINEKENEINSLNQKLGKISSDLYQASTQLKNKSKQLINELQKTQKLTNEISKLNTRLEQSKLNISKIQNHGRHTIIQLQNKYHNVNVKLQFIEKQATSWKRKSQQLEQSFLIEKTKREQYESKWSQCESVRLSLSQELSQLISNTKRSQQQIQLYEREISLKNKSISQLKQIIKVVKNESLLVKEEVDSYRIQFEEMQVLRQQDTNRSNQLALQYQQLERLTLQQIKYMRQRLEDLDFDKKDLSIQIIQLKEKNVQLQEILKEVSIEIDWRQHKTAYQSEIFSLKQAIAINNGQHERIKSYLQENLQSLNSQLELKGKKLQLVAKMLEDQRQQSSQKISQALKDYESTKYILEQQNAISENLAKIIEQKEEVIKQLTQKSHTYQSKKNMIRSQVQSIQNQISILSDRNISLQETNEILSTKVKEFQEKQKLYEQKLCTIIENKYLNEQRNGQLEQQIKMLQQQLNRSQQRQISLNEQSQRKIKQVYQICERRKEEIVKQLTINLNSKHEQTTLYVRKNAQVQEVLRENHQFLENEKSLRQKLQIQVTQLRNELDKMSVEISSTKRDSECLARDKAIAKERLAEVQHRYQTLIKKLQAIEQQKASLVRQLQNNQMTIRVLREENSSIQKVMTQQINQHKSIIQQLVNQKRLLYSQFQHQ